METGDEAGAALWPDLPPPNVVAAAWTSYYERARAMHGALAPTSADVRRWEEAFRLLDRTEIEQLGQSPPQPTPPAEEQAAPHEGGPVRPLKVAAFMSPVGVLIGGAFWPIQPVLGVVAAAVMIVGVPMFLALLPRLMERSLRSRS